MAAVTLRLVETDRSDGDHPASHVVPARAPISPPELALDPAPAFAPDVEGARPGPRTAPLAASVDLPPPEAASAAAPKPLLEAFSVSLLRGGMIAPHAMVEALARQARGSGPLLDSLLSRGSMVEVDIYATLARRSGVPVVDLAAMTADPRLIDRVGAAACLRMGVLPLLDLGGRTLVACACPDVFARHRAALEADLGPLTVALAPRHAIDTHLTAVRGAVLARAAETSVEADLSSRQYGGMNILRFAALGTALVAGAAALSLPGFLAVLCAWAILTLAACVGLKLAAAIAACRPPVPEGPAPIIARLPVVSVMVALYREAEIAPRLVRRLSRLDYPRDLLDIVLVVEAEDRLTLLALERSGLPPWMRIVVVPQGRVRTKPRALNYALNHCRGSLIGVYDAEDAPQPDQIRRVVDRFHARGANVACLQGVLDYYNPHTNWLSRCFTLEYAAWFRLMLPGIARLGLAVPLGGTTLFFRRAALEEVGAWDAWNVTEDADLGIRLARHGYVTELIDTVTYEEANCRARPWVNQRSRWIKGYMMTWLVHMRDPVRLWRDLGPRRFAGFQVMFLGSLSQALFAPLLWSFWVLPFGLPHPVADLMAPELVFGLMVLCVGSEAVSLVLGYVALRRARRDLNPLWLLTMPLYFPLGTIAAFKAAWEMVVRPFYWDKTSHGHFDKATPDA